MQTQGPEIHQLLASLFKMHPKQRPHFELGIEALRRVEIGQLCEKAGINIDLSKGKDDLVQIVNGYVLEGRFDHLVTKPVDEIAELRKELAALREQVKGREKLTVRG